MYRKNYRCVVEGQQEQMYLNHLAKLVTNFPKTVVTFNISEGNAYDLTKSYIEYDSACLFDYDFNKTEFEDNLMICDRLYHQNKPGKRKAGKFVYHAYSNVCFDLWLLLHKKDFVRPVLKNDGYVDGVIKAYGLPKGSDIKNAKVMEIILKQISLEDVKAAIQRASAIKNAKDYRDAHHVNTAVYYDNPDLSIHEFVSNVFDDIK